MKYLILKTNKACPNRYAKRYRRGFTLVETLVAISIFSVSLMALMSVLANGIASTSYVKEKDTAIYLAQEGIEYMRNMRDTYVLYSSSPQAGWDAFKNKLTENSCTGVNGCYFNADGLFTTISSPMEMTKISFGTCTSFGCSNAPMLYNSSTGKYGYTAGSATNFIRKINVQVSTNETKILSTVYWTQGSGTYNLTLSENLFNWVE
ncbi:MAG: type II secretion system protein [Candidatus Pacebacteria bacterium]|nr:type II secretion system protein [Candidatus Paceibacterota bacterium]